MDRGKQVVMAAREEGSHDHKNFPPGYRFIPNDVEILHYLKLKILNKPVRIDSITDVELYKYHPHDLCQISRMNGKKEWYFFTSRAKKYSNGGRPNRRAADGYWKATGREVTVQSNGQEVGRKKVLVYYEGKSNEGSKTNWIMHEFTIHGMKDIVARSSINLNPNPDDNMRLDTCLCRIYYRTAKSRKNKEQDSQENLIPFPTQDTHVDDHANLAATSNQNPLPSTLDQSSLEGAYFPDPRSNTVGLSINNYQYPLVEPSNPPLTYMHGDHMILQRNIKYSSLPSPQPLTYIPGPYNPLLTTGTDIHGNCMAMEINDQYQPITCMNGTDDDYMDLKDPCFSSLSDLLPPTDLSLRGGSCSSDVQLQSLPIHMHGDVGCSTSNFAASTSTSNDDDWLDQLDMFLPPFDPSMLDLPFGDSSNRLFQPENVHGTGTLKGDGDVPESTPVDKI